MVIETLDSVWQEIVACRLCGGEVQDVLDLRHQPPANSLRLPLEDPAPFVPLKLVRCSSCSVVQLTATVEPSYLFSKYVWVTATSATARAYSQFFCDEVLKRVNEVNPFVVEIASNDGTFLSKFKQMGCRILGVDPAVNIASAATANGIPTLPEFFDETNAQRILETYGLPEVVIARNVIPHVKEIHSIAKGLATLAGASGVVAIEFHYAKAIVEELHYDSIYHEHLFYFSLKSLTNVFCKYGLKAFDVFSSPISGGSLVLFLSATANKKSTALSQLIAEEDAACLNDLDTWQHFGHATRQHAHDLQKLVTDYTKEKALIGYGASARGSTLMNFAGISHKEVEYVIDRNPLKHGMLTPGTDIPIVSYESGRELLLGRDLLLLAWNFEDEVVSDLRSSGFTGDIIVPLPNKIHIR